MERVHEVVGVVLGRVSDRLAHRGVRREVDDGLDAIHDEQVIEVVDVAEVADDEPLGLDARSRSLALAGVGVLALLCAVGDWAGAFWFPWPLAILAAVVIWFVLGFVFFATLYAATGAVVSRQEELGSSSAPLTILAMAVVYSAYFGIGSLDSTLMQTLAWIPPFSASMCASIRFR